MSEAQGNQLIDLATQQLEEAQRLADLVKAANSCLVGIIYILLTLLFFAIIGALRRS
jgi:hypothetical protein